VHIISHRFSVYVVKIKFLLKTALISGSTFINRVQYAIIVDERSDYAEQAYASTVARANAGPLDSSERVGARSRGAHARPTAVGVSLPTHRARVRSSCRAAPKDGLCRVGRRYRTDLND
jgi:hypothetical protein